MNKKQPSYNACLEAHQKDLNQVYAMSLFGFLLDSSLQYEDNFVDTYPGMPEPTLPHIRHPVEALLLQVYTGHESTAEELEMSNAYLVDFCLHTQFNIVFTESNLMLNPKYYYGLDFETKYNDLDFINSMRIKVINYLLLRALVNQRAKEALIRLIEVLAENHKGITLSAKEYASLIKSLRTSIKLHREDLFTKKNSPTTSFQSSLVNANLDEIEQAINKLVSEI